MSSGKKKCKVCKSWHEQGACAVARVLVKNTIIPDGVYEIPGRDFAALAAEAIEDHADLLSRLKDRKTISHAEAWAEKEGGTKHDAGKPDLTLLPQEALHSIARAFEYGAKKYTRGNYKKGMAYSRVLAAAFRHGFAYASGEQRDPESGLSHLAHMGACVCMLLFYEVSGKGTNDLTGDQT